MKTRSLINRVLTAFTSVLVLAAFFMLLNNCSVADSNSAFREGDTLKGLKDFYKDYFPIGVAVAPNSFNGAQGTLIKKHFNSMTCENVMKPGPIHPEENRYN